MSKNKIIYGLVLLFIFYIHSGIADHIEKFLPLKATIWMEAIILALIYAESMTRGIKSRFYILENWLLLSFVLLNWISLYQNGNFSFYSQNFRWLFVMLFMYFAIIAVADDLQKVRSILFVAILATLLKFILSIYSYGLFGRMESYAAISRIGGNVNPITYLMYLPICMYFIRYPYGLSRNAFKIITVILMAGAFLSYSRGAMLTLTAILLFYAFRKKKVKTDILLKTITVLIVILLLMPSGFWGRMRLFITDPTGTGRTSAWSTAITIIKEKPLTGMGAGNFRKHYFRYASAKDAFYKYKQKGKTFAGGFFNDFLDIAAKIGIPALILYLFFLWRNWKNLDFVRNSYHKIGVQDVTLLAESLQYILLIYIIGSQFLHNLYLSLPIFFAVNVSLKSILAEDLSTSIELAANG